MIIAEKKNESINVHSADIPRDLAVRSFVRSFDHSILVIKFDHGKLSFDRYSMKGRNLLFHESIDGLFHFEGKLIIEMLFDLSQFGFIARGRRWMAMFIHVPFDRLGPQELEGEDSYHNPDFIKQLS